MYNRQSLHVALLLWGCIFSLIAAFCMFISRNFDREKRRWLILIQLSSALLLISDAFAWGYRGSMAAEAAMLVRLSNFLVFMMSDVLLVFFHGYLCCSLFPESRNRISLVKIVQKTEKQKSESKLKKPEKALPDKRILAVYLIIEAGIILVILSQFTHLYYYIDADNYYHRSPAHFISMIIPIAGMIIDASIVIENRKNIKKARLKPLTSEKSLI